jgi:hypothetical protein
MKVFNGNIDSIEDNFYRNSASISDGVASITRTIYFESENENECAADIINLAEFPQVRAAHPTYAQYKYYGNANIAPLTEKSKYWKAELEYSTARPSQTDSDGNQVTSETPPWKLLPDNITFSAPEIVVPFDKGYVGNKKYDTDGNVLAPVTNSAGDIIVAESVLHNIQMTFNYAVRDWDVSNIIDFADTINSVDITVCGLPIKAKSALMRAPEPRYITVYEDGSNKIKWQYWDIGITLLIEKGGELLERKFLDIGDRAIFPAMTFNDALTAAASVNPSIPASNGPEKICHFRKTVKYNVGGKEKYWPMGDLVFCGWSQFLQIRQMYLDASMNIPDMAATPYELQCEQDSQMPLDGNGGLYYAAIKGHPSYTGAPYKTRNFSGYSTANWSGLDMPTKGIK